MTSKKTRKKLKQQYQEPEKFHFFDNDPNAQKDREIILNFLKANANTIVTSTQLLQCDLYFYSQSSVSNNIRYIKENIDPNIITKRCKGYMYVR